MKATQKLRSYMAYMTRGFAKHYFLVQKIDLDITRETVQNMVRNCHQRSASLFILLQACTKLEKS